MNKAREYIKGNIYVLEVEHRNKNSPECDNMHSKNTTIVNHSLIHGLIISWNSNEEGMQSSQILLS